MALGTEQNIQLLYALANNTLPTDKYFCDRFDDDVAVKYYGFVTKCGDGYYIMRETITGTEHVYEWYTTDLSLQSYPQFLVDWANRAALNYLSIVETSPKLK